MAPKKLADVQPGDRRLQVTGKIVAIDTREIEVKGETRMIYRGLIGDETEVLPFTAWKDYDMHVGDVVILKNAYANEWSGQARLNISEWTDVTKTNQTIELAERKPQRFTIIDLRPGLSNVEVTGKILSLEEREVTVDDAGKTVYTGLLGDTSGKIQYNAWHDFELQEGDVILITGAYTKSWRGTPQLVFDENATLKKLDEDIATEDIAQRPVPLYKVVEGGGGVDIIMEGSIIEIMSGSGLIERCPQCNRAIRDNLCIIDGEVTGQADLRIKAVVDDGTGAVTAIFDRGMTEQVMGQSMSDFQDMEKKDGEGVVDRSINDALMARPIRITGNALADEYGITVIVRDATLLRFDVAAESQQLLDNMESGT
jgi:replication factor A1